MGDSDDKDSLYRILQFSVYILALYLFGKIFSKAYARIIGEILVGLVLGPQVLDFIPFPDAISMLGEIGLLLIILSGGLSISFKQLQTIGIRAFLIAILGISNLLLFVKHMAYTHLYHQIGTIVPVGLGWGLVVILGYDSLEGLACGTALSSTSMGVTVTVLQQQNYLTTETGKLIAVAAMVDDIASLVILAVITQLSDSKKSDESEGKKVWNILGPLVISIAYILFGIFLTKVLIPKSVQLIDAIYNKRAKDLKLQVQKKKQKLDSQEQLNIQEEQIDQDITKMKSLTKIAYLIIVGAILSIAVGYSGSTYLLGAFIAGMAFSEIGGLENDFDKRKQTKEWLSKIFFSSLGFVIPIKETLTWKSLGGGLLYTIPAILGKLFTGAFAHKGDGWIVGWAMVGRGELGFVMAKTALEKDIMGKFTFSICVWALIIATFISPFIFKYCIVRKERSMQGKKQPGKENYLASQENMNEKEINDQENGENQSDQAIISEQGNQYNKKSQDFVISTPGQEKMKGDSEIYVYERKNKMNNISKDHD